MIHDVVARTRLEIGCSCERDSSGVDLVEVPNRYQLQFQRKVGRRKDRAKEEIPVTGEVDLPNRVRSQICSNGTQHLCELHRFLLQSSATKVPEAGDDI